ncbi:MAG: helix-turn-helix domain-containing protein [Bacteroidales bacterium]|nr:helix-turn-helix domain-containing protein [Bacteroidales bacterium]
MQRDASYEKIDRNINHSFYVNRLRASHFFSPLHYHPEVEILLITRGSGNLLLGDSVREFQPGTLAIIGKNVPHVWLNSKEHYQDDRFFAEAIYIQFDERFAGEMFMNLTEMKTLNELLSRARRGIFFGHETSAKVQPMMKEIVDREGFGRIRLLFDILDVLSSSTDFDYMASEAFHYHYNSEDMDRIGKVYEFINQNYFNPISLKDVADIANLSKNAFCRYFKKHTGKTFLDFLTSFRLGKACKYLEGNELSVKEVCYMTGFANLSNFNRKFKEKIRMTPLQYRNFSKNPAGRDGV